MYDAIVIGARCAGSPVAMLLARKGYKVLLLDKATFPDDTVCSQYIPPSGAAKLRDWGLLEKVLRSGCVPIYGTRAEFGEISLAGENLPCQGVSSGLCPRRQFLDAILQHAACEAGAEFRDGFTVEELLQENGRICGVAGRGKNGRTGAERAYLVIGADGMRSTVARQVCAAEYQTVEPRTCIYYSYWETSKRPGPPAAELLLREGRLIFAAPMERGLTMIAVAAPRSCFRLFRANPAQFFFDSLKLAPAIYEWLRRSKQAGPFIGTADTPNSFRKPFGPGWALVGDAGYHRDPVVFQGIADAFCHAELLVEALDKGFNAGTLSAFQQQRDKSVAPMYKLALEMARLESQNLWPMEMLEFLATHSEQRNRFLATLAGTLPIAEFQREIRTLFQTSRSSAPQQPRSQL